MTAYLIYLFLTWTPLILFIVGIQLMFDPPTLAFSLIGGALGMVVTLFAWLLKRVDDLYWEARAYFEFPTARISNSWGRIYNESADPWSGDHYEGTSLRDFEED